MRLLYILTAALPLVGQGSLEAQGLKDPRVSDRLWELAPGAAAAAPGSRARTADASLVLPGVQPALAPAPDGTVVISATAVDDSEALAAELTALGALDCAVAGRVVSARLPVSAIPSLGGLANLSYARAGLAVANSVVVSQGDHALAADAARATFGVAGADIRVGILSDSFNLSGGMAGGITAGELPDQILILADATSGNDEGRAMGEIVHDVAPGASLAYHTATQGEADFALGIRELHAAGCQVIVDDVIYLNEPMFADGVIAQAVDDVTAAGGAYFSAAGNASDRGYTGVYCQAANGCHDFDASSGTDTVLNITLFPGVTWFTFQWADRYECTGFNNGGARTDLDIELTDVNGQSLTPRLGSFDANIGHDPVEVFGVSVTGGFVEAGLRIRYKDGPPPPLVKVIWYTSNGLGTERLAQPTSTVFGHMNARGAMTTGAAWYCNTPAFGVSPPVAESFSSMGGTPIYFAPNGTAMYELRQKPDFCAPDGADTSFFYPGSDYDCSGANGHPNFFGTSAAAPHAAAVAALMLEARPTSPPGLLRTTLQATAIEMGTAGFDFRTGYGLVQANAAMARLTRPPVAEGQAATTLEDAGAAIALAGSDPNGFPVSFEVATGPAHGTLGGTAPNLVYTPAPDYAGDDAFTFRVSNGYAQSAPATVGLTVTAVNDAPRIIEARQVNPGPVTGVSTALSLAAADVDGPQALSFVWSLVSGPAAVGFDEASVANPVVSFTQAGDYVLGFVVSDGLAQVSGELPVTVEATLSGITVSPASAVVTTGLTQPFSALASDQFGDPLPSLPTLDWAVSGGGTISAAAVFTAGASAGGPYTVTATSGAVQGTAQITVVTPPTLQSVVSRKNHNGVGTFDTSLPLAGTPGVEGRNGTTLQLVFTFDRDVEAATAVVELGAAGLASAPIIRGPQVTVDLANASSGQWLRIALQDIRATDGGFASRAPVTVGRLIADANRDRVASFADIYYIQSRNGQITGAANYRADVNCDGVISFADVYLAQSKNGTFLPTAP